MAAANTIKKVDIFINGRTYTINCPVEEQPALERAASYINNFIQDVRKQAPQLPQEELLVLCALTLYEKSEQLALHQSRDEEARTLVAQILANADTIDH